MTGQGKTPWATAWRLAIFAAVLGTAVVTVGRLPVLAQQTREGASPRSHGGSTQAVPTASEQGPRGNPRDTQSPSFSEVPWKLRPYRILISVAVEPSPALSPSVIARLQDALRVRIAGLLGRYWDTRIETNRWLLPASEVALERLDDDVLSQQFRAADFDKVMVLTITHGHPLRLAGCEWDRTLATRGPILRRTIVDRRLAVDAAVELLLDLFRPLVRIDAAEEGVAELRSRAGELLAPGTMAVTFQPDDLLSPYYRYLDREQKVRRIQAVPWTYLRVSEVTRSRMTAAVETAFAAPLVEGRRRVELVAIRVTPHYPATRLRLSLRNSPGRPLVGARVRVYEHLPTDERPNPSGVELMTDRFGRVEVPRPDGDPLRRLLVISGGAVLASVPFVPGLDREVSLELPDDSPRLQAEGSLAIVQGELIDLVARRSVMLARALSLARHKQWDDVDEVMAAVDQQPSISAFQSKILAIRVPAVEEARRNRDRAAEKRIIAMCRHVEELVERYLSRDAVREAAAEINELKELSQKSPGVQ